MCCYYKTSKADFFPGFLGPSLKSEGGEGGAPQTISLLISYYILIEQGEDKEGTDKDWAAPRPSKIKEIKEIKEK